MRSAFLLFFFSEKRCFLFIVSWFFILHFKKFQWKKLIENRIIHFNALQIARSSLLYTCKKVNEMKTETIVMCPRRLGKTVHSYAMDHTYELSSRFTFVVNVLCIDVRDDTRERRRNPKRFIHTQRVNEWVDYSVALPNDTQAQSDIVLHAYTHSRTRSFAQPVFGWDREHRVTFSTFQNEVAISSCVRVPRTAKLWLCAKVKQ